MVADEEILREVEMLGRLSDKQEDILYNIALKQDELGREPTNLLYSKMKDSPVYVPLIERGYLTYEIFNHGGSHEVASMYVTLKGMRYCITFSDELSRRRKLNPAGAPWSTSNQE